MLTIQDYLKVPFQITLGFYPFNYPSIFNCIFPEEIPQGLPPKRDIQDHIDIILGAVLLDKQAYRMNCEDTMRFKGKWKSWFQKDRLEKP